MAMTKLQIYRGTEAQRTADTSVLAGGSIITTQEGHIYVADGVTQTKDLVAGVGGGGGGTVTSVNGHTGSAVVLTAADVALSSVSKTANYTATANQMISADATGAAFAITLPTTPPVGTQVMVKKVDTSTNLVTINAGGTAHFDTSTGSNSTTLTLPNQAKTFQYSSGVWVTASDDLSLTQLDTHYDARYTPMFAAAGSVPVNLTDLGGKIGYSQLASGAIISIDFTSANYNTLARPNVANGVRIWWIGDASTSSATLPTNAISGDIIDTAS